MKYFVGMELGVANVLQRHFDWSSNSLWYDEIPNACDPSKTIFFVGGKDDIVDAKVCLYPFQYHMLRCHISYPLHGQQRVQRYLTSHGIRKGLRFNPEGRHGEALLTGGESHMEILRWLHESHDYTPST